MHGIIPSLFRHEFSIPSLAARYAGGILHAVFVCVFVGVCVFLSLFPQSNKLFHLFGLLQLTCGEDSALAAW